MTTTAKGWAFPRGAKNACYFVVVAGFNPSPSLCGKRYLQNAHVHVNDEYNYKRHDDTCQACAKQKEKLDKGEAEL